MLAKLIDFTIFFMRVLLVTLGATTAADTLSCLHRDCSAEISGCTRRGDCAALFTCVGAGDCAHKFPPDTALGRCLTRCGNSTDDEVSGNFRNFWETRNTLAEKHLQSFKPLNIEFSFPEFRVDTSGPTLRRRLVENSKTRLLKLVDQLAATAELGVQGVLLETDKSTFSGLRELREKIERDVDNLLKRDM
jgi:hypothetical protein